MASRHFHSLPLILSALIALPSFSQQPIDGSAPFETNAPQDCVDCTSDVPLLGPQINQRNRKASPFETTINPNQNYSDTESYTRQKTLDEVNRRERLSREPLSEFQKFVSVTTGLVLPIYGARLFQQVPSTFAPLESSPVPPDFVIGPGDELRIRTWGQISLQANLRVDRSGDVFIPQVGPVHVASLTVAELDGHLRQAIGKMYHNFDLSVDLGQIRSIQVYFSGEAREPGVYTVSSLSTMVDALFAAGGPNPGGSLRRIALRRSGKIVTELDLYQLLRRGDKTGDSSLLPGDVIYIPPAGPQVAVYGSVRNPSIYELRPGETLASLLDMAGGVSSVASDARVSIERIEQHRSRHAIEVPYDQSGLRIPLADGDIIRVFSIVPKYTDTVVLRGNVANPGRFAWHAGMHLSDLIPDKDSLITRNYWWKRTQLGLPTPEFAPDSNVADLNQPTDANVIQLKQNLTEGAEPSQPSPNRQLTADQRAGNSSLAAQQSNDSSHFVSPGQRTEVKLLTPDIDWDYAVIERVNPDSLKTELVPFDLGKLVLQHDATQDLELDSGDVVSIFSESDLKIPLAQQTKLVTLEGEFIHGGVYSVRADETLKELVERAGGFTSKAYLYGSEFTRESTRQNQQARIDEYVQSLSRRIQRSNLELASSASGSTQELAAGVAAKSSEQDLLAEMRQIRASGRVVLEFRPASKGMDNIPDLPLENGDRFVVPPIPSVVNIVGSVYNQDAFVYSPARTVGSYLSLAGGPNKDADRKHEFVIRANGNVVSRDNEGGAWGDNFSRLHVYPGDTVVVPEKTFRPSAIRGLIDWSQVFSQLALGAAAVNVIK